MDFATYMGFPPDPSGSLPPQGLESTLVAYQSQGTPQISSIQSVWNTIKEDAFLAVNYVDDFAENTYSGIKDIGKTVYGDAKSAVGTVYDDVTKPIQNALTGTYWYLIVAVVVIAGGLYFVGKGGAVSVRV